MRIVGWPEGPDAEGGILPITIVDLDFHGTPTELRAIANLLLNAAAELERAQSGSFTLDSGMQLDNSNGSSGVGLSINVVRHADE